MNIEDLKIVAEMSIEKLIEDSKIYHIEILERLESAMINIINYR